MQHNLSIAALKVQPTPKFMNATIHFSPEKLLSPTYTFHFMVFICRSHTYKLQRAQELLLHYSATNEHTINFNYPTTKRNKTAVDQKLFRYIKDTTKCKSTQLSFISFEYFWLRVIHNKIFMVIWKTFPGQTATPSQFTREKKSNTLGITAAQFFLHTEIFGTPQRGFIQSRG